MKHLGTVALETDRLILRRFTEDDIQAAYNNWTSDDRVTEYLRWPTHASIDITRRVMSVQLA
ncbi:MAG: GNAT family N-acetyltransferase [Gudongella sp.]|nr:GNAT family N-acetyltransferase [Gudongella sp.]